MAHIFDLVVIGSGTAASVAALRCRKAGWRVALIDHQPFGGTCALRGCDPKKVLVGAAEAIDAAARLRDKGVGGGAPAIDWHALMVFKRSFTDPVPATREHSFAKSGVTTFHGRARFTGPRTVVVEQEQLEARFILIATGAVPMPLKIPGAEHLATSADFLDLDDLPPRIVFVGGGYIANEFAHVAVRAGADVTVLEQGPHILPQFDPDLVKLLIERSRRLGIKLHLSTPVTAIEKRRSFLIVHSGQAEQQRAIYADLVVHGAGRVPDLDMNLGAAGVAADNGRLRLNEYLQSATNPAVYAAGDAANIGPALTPVAGHDGIIVAANLLDGNRAKPNYAAIPSVVFTIPALARVGLLEAEARSQGLRFRSRHDRTSDWYTAKRVGEEAAGFKVLVEEETERILGAHLLGPHAEDVINLFALAIHSGLRASALRDLLTSYPTASSDVGYML